MRRPLPAVLLAVALALAAVGVAVALARSPGEDGPPSDPRRAVVAALATRPRDVADSARYGVRYIIQGPGIRPRQVASYEGSADLERQRFRSRGHLSEEGGGGREYDSFVFSEWEYTRSAGEQRWRRRFFDPRSVGAPTPELGVVGGRSERLVGPTYTNDVQARRQIVEALTADVVPLGRGQHRGATVWHYRVTVDGARAVGRLPEPVLNEMRSWEEGRGRREVDLWLDGRARLRKLSIFYDQGEGLGYRVENEFWDFGGPGRLELPSDLDDRTATGGEGVTSFTLRPGVELDADSPSFGMSVFDNDMRGAEVTLHIDDRPAPGGPFRRRSIRIVPPPDQHLEPGEYRMLDTRGSGRPAPRTFYALAPEVDERCPRDAPRSGTLTVSEAVMYEESFYVRLHVRFTVTCQPSGGAAPVTFEGEARYHALT